VLAARLNEPTEASSTPSRCDRPGARGVRARRRRRRRRRLTRLARAANELAAGIEGLENLAPGAFASTVLLEGSGALSATQAKTVLGELLANGETPLLSPRRWVSSSFRRTHSAETVGALIGEYPDEWSRYARATRSSPSSSLAR